MDALPIGIEPIKISPLNGGYNWLYRFDNGYGASVILHEGSYGHEEGLYELLLVKYIGDGPSWKSPEAAMIDSISESEPGGDGYGLWGWLTLDEVTSILGAVRGYESPIKRAIKRDVPESRPVTMINHDGVWKGTDTSRW